MGTPRVCISRHAKQRWQEYQGRGKLTEGKVARKLMGLLRIGAKPRGRGVWAGLGEGKYAVLVPTAWGSWIVVTVVDKHREEAG